jgi:hypothetical protein
MQETKSWAKEEEVGLTPRQKASDKVNLILVRIEKILIW